MCKSDYSAKYPTAKDVAKHVYIEAGCSYGFWLVEVYISHRLPDGRYWESYTFAKRIPTYEDYPEFHYDEPTKEEAEIIADRMKKNTKFRLQIAKALLPGLLRGLVEYT